MENFQSALKWHKRVCVQRHMRLVTRAVRMSPSEVADRTLRVFRSRQRGRDAARRAKLLGSTASDWLASLPGHPERRQIIASACDAQFFFGPASHTALRDLLSRELPSAEGEILTAADGILEGSVLLLGESMQLNPETLDWQADPISGRRVWDPEIGDEGSAIVSPEADVKYVWELNRQQFLTTLGRAYWLTGDTKYARRAAVLLERWLDQNPPGFGVNWCSYLEVGMRSISWMWSLPFLVNAPELDDALLDRWLVSLAQHYQHLRDNLSVHTDPTNHLIGETTALWMLTHLPGLPDAPAERERCELLLLRALDSQVHEDGVNTEQASSYHRFVLDFYLQLLVLKRRQGTPLPPSAESRIESMIDFAAYVGGDRGKALMIGDSDDARGLPLLELVGWSFDDVVSAGALIFERDDWYRQAGGLRQEHFWLLGAEAVATHERLAARAQTDDDAGLDAPSRIFAHGGYGFLRSPRQSESGAKAELIFDCGPIGLWPNAAHGHADALSVMIRIDGETLLGDPGTGTYFGDPGLRDRMRRTDAHNTLTIDGGDQADILDVFKWVNPMSVCLKDWFADSCFDFVSATHDGYARLRQPVRHKRSILSLQSGRWILLDSLTGSGEHEVTRCFNFAPGVTLDRQAPGQFIARLGDARLQFSFADVSAESCRLDQEGCWSSTYGRTEPAARLRVRGRLRMPAHLVTFIDTVREAGNEQILQNEHPHQAISVTRQIPGGDGSAGESVLINPNQATQELGHGLASSAEIAYWAWAPGGLDRAFAVGGMLSGSDAKPRTDPTGRFSVYS